MARKSLIERVDTSELDRMVKAAKETQIRTRSTEPPEERGAIMVGDELWAWQERTPDGRWGIVAAQVPTLAHLLGDSPIPLVFRERPLGVEMRPVAELHSERTGNPIRFAKFTLAEVEAL